MLAAGVAALPAPPKRARPPPVGPQLLKVAEDVTRRPQQRSFPGSAPGSSIPSDNAALGSRGLPPSPSTARAAATRMHGAIASALVRIPRGRLCPGALSTSLMQVTSTASAASCTPDLSSAKLTPPSEPSPMKHLIHVTLATGSLDATRAPRPPAQLSGLQVVATSTPSQLADLSTSSPLVDPAYHLAATESLAPKPKPPARPRPKHAHHHDHHQPPLVLPQTLEVSERYQAVGDAARVVESPEEATRLLHVAEVVVPLATSLVARDTQTDACSGIAGGSMPKAVPMIGEFAGSAPATLSAPVGGQVLPIAVPHPRPRPKPRKVPLTVLPLHSSPVDAGSASLSGVPTVTLLPVPIGLVGQQLAAATAVVPLSMRPGSPPAAPSLLPSTAAAVASPLSQQQQDPVLPSLAAPPILRMHLRSGETRDSTSSSSSPGPASPRPQAALGSVQQHQQQQQHVSAFRIPDASFAPQLCALPVPRSSSARSVTARYLEWTRSHPPLSAATSAVRRPQSAAAPAQAPARPIHSGHAQAASSVVPTQEADPSVTARLGSMQAPSLYVRGPAALTLAAITVLLRRLLVDADDHAAASVIGATSPKLDGGAGSAATPGMEAIAGQLCRSLRARSPFGVLKSPALPAPAASPPAMPPTHRPLVRFTSPRLHQQQGQRRPPWDASPLALSVQSECTGLPLSASPSFLKAAIWGHAESSGTAGGSSNSDGSLTSSPLPAGTAVRGAWVPEHLEGLLLTAVSDTSGLQWERKRRTTGSSNSGSPLVPASVLAHAGGGTTQDRGLGQQHSEDPPRSVVQRTERGTFALAQAASLRSPSTDDQREVQRYPEGKAAVPPRGSPGPSGFGSLAEQGSDAGTLRRLRTGQAAEGWPSSAQLQGAAADGSQSAPAPCQCSPLLPTRAPSGVAALCRDPRSPPAHPAAAAPVSASARLMLDVRRLDALLEAAEAELQQQPPLDEDGPRSAGAGSGEGDRRPWAPPEPGHRLTEHNPAAAAASAEALHSAQVSACRRRAASGARAVAAVIAAADDVIRSVRGAGGSSAAGSGGLVSLSGGSPPWPSHDEEAEARRTQQGRGARKMAQEYLAGK